jgi:hypothetical protein
LLPKIINADSGRTIRASDGKLNHRVITQGHTMFSQGLKLVDDGVIMQLCHGVAIAAHGKN